MILDEVFAEDAEDKPLKKTKLAIIVEIEYDERRFQPTNNTPSGVADLCDVAVFLDCSEFIDHCSPDSPDFYYRLLPDVSVYTVDGFLADVAEGVFKKEEGP